MFKLAIATTAAKKYRKSSFGEDEALAIIFGIVIILFLLAIGVASPIAIIVDGAKLCAGKTPEWIGFIGTLISYIASFVIIPSTILYNLEPWAPSSYSEEYEKYLEDMKVFRKERAFVLLATFIVLAGVVAIAVLAVNNTYKNPSTAGVLSIILGAFALILNIAAVIVRVLE